MKKILVVDDDSILRTVLKHSLEREGYQIQEVASGNEGLTAFTQFIPDVIVSDVAMPMMDGFEFCRRLRSQPTGQLVPFIFLSAKNDLEYRIQGHDCGADDYLTKPFEMKELLAKIDSSIERTRRIHAEIVHLIQQISSNQTNASPLPASASNGQSTQPNNNSNNSSNANTNRYQPVPLPLTPAEERVFWEVIQGHTNRQISDRLFISHRTVQTHLSNILNKLNLENRTQLVRFAYEQGYSQS
jgi:DNA-binding NarL/FixJ family response regulator